MNNLLVVALVALLAVATATAAKRHHQPVVSGLTWGHYRSSCPHVESIIRNRLKDLLEEDIGLAAGLLRLHFHDCFVQGCDGSVLLVGADSEQEAPPNRNSLRPEAIKTIGDLQELIVKECGEVVSCADITALAARDSIYMSGGPHYEIPLGRKDSLTHAITDVTNANLPRADSNTTVLLSDFSVKGLDATDLVALSGGHTIGHAHCGAFSGRLYPTRDPTLAESLAKKLEKTCPTANTPNVTTMMDIRTPNTFDNKYFVNLVHREGLFTSDQDLYMDSTTKDIVVEFANDQSYFFDKFVDSMIKMGQLSVLTGTQGEVRANCSVRNTGNEALSSVLRDAQEEQAQFKWY